MEPKKFLLWLLAGVFLYQASLFTYAFHKCASVSPTISVREVCPEIGKRYEQTFSLMIATVLGLYSGSQLNKSE
tara:strand:+ start:202 stop:423 length:222 start_codon:yes stop_codon:yes gene_type:complete